MELVKATKELTTETQSWPDRARAIQVTTGGQYAAVAQMLVGIKTLRNQVDQVIGPVVRDAHTAHKSALALKKAADDPLDEAERILKERMVDYRRRQDAQDQAERLLDSIGQTTETLQSAIQRITFVTGIAPERDW